MANEDDPSRNSRLPRNVGDLLQVCVANQSSSGQDGQDPVQTMNPERRAWLENALEDLTTDPIQRMKACVATLQNREASSDDMEKSLDELTEWCEHIDFAIDFHKIGAFQILPALLNSEEPEIRWRTLELIATLVQNNPYCQKVALNEGLLELMLTTLDKDPVPTVKVKALYGISCLTRDVPDAQNRFAEHDGFSVIMRAMQCNVEKLKIKSAFMLSTMCSNNPAYKDVLCDIGMIDQLVGELSGEHVNYHEHLMSALLAIVQDHKRGIDECQRPELQLPKLLQNRIQLLQGKEEFIEERSYAEELLKIISSEESDVTR